MATGSNLLGLPPPMPSEDLSEGNLSQAWTRWRQRFELYLTATKQNVAGTSDEVKTASLLHAIGPEGLEVYNSFAFEDQEDKTKYHLVLTRFENHYMPKKNLTYERYKFFSRSQLGDETIDPYAAELRRLARSCEFGDLRGDTHFGRWGDGAEKFLGKLGSAVEIAEGKTKKAEFLCYWRRRLSLLLQSLNANVMMRKCRRISGLSSRPNLSTEREIQFRVR
eukprot:m.255019 g.255019  ORF g.255019 m.255019 type:complete len:222 (+) comp40390_c0_seq1:107-772(+)